jgi:flagellar basal body-associated protein FliL
MADPNLRDFYGRIYRIQKRHRRGGGFEATGTLGRSYFVAPPSRSINIVRPLIMVAIAVTVVKVLMLAAVGPADYASRIAALESGSTIDRVGAVVMTVDPVTGFLAGKISDLRNAQTAAK